MNGSMLARLTKADEAMFRQFGIDVDLVVEAGVRRVDDAEGHSVLGSTHKGDLAGLLFPYIDPVTGHTVGGRLRRDRPEVDAKGQPSRKYLAPYGNAPHIYFAPGAGAVLADVTVPVFMVEAEKSALAFLAACRRADRTVLVVALGGAHGWHTGRAGKTVDANGARVNVTGPQPDLSRITWTGREVVIIFDANATTNSHVKSARRKLADELTSRGARVRIATVPEEPGVNGPDDYRAHHDDVALLTLIDDAILVQPATVNELLEDCGLLTLTVPVDLRALEQALRELASRLRGADAIRRKLARTAALGFLKTLKVDGATQVIDAAIGGAVLEADAQGPALVRDDEPWPEPVDGAAVLTSVVQTLQKYLVLPAHAADAIALWIVHAYAMAVWSISALLTFISPVKRCGKTTTLLVVGALAPRSLNVSNLTVAVLFRVIDVYAPTLLSDEADTWLTDEKSELRGVFNGSHTRGTSVVPRCDGDDHEVRLFSTWAAKVIAMIGRPPGTIEDRSIVIELRRKSSGEHVSRLRLDRIDAETSPIRQQLQRWTADHLDALREADPAVPGALNDRAQDNWRQLLAVADVVGGSWPARARTAALALSGNDVAEDIGAELLADIKMVFADADDPVVLSSADILKGLVEMEDRPWAEWSKGKPINGSKLARMLKPFKVFSAGTVRVGATTKKGYRREAFADAWTCYLPPDPGLKASHRHNPNKTGPETPIPTRHTVQGCDASESAVEADKHCLCDDVTLSNPDPGGNGPAEGEGASLSPESEAFDL